ncbi:aminoglycoside phosphotransferase family protein [Sporomusa termitida]|uniref:Aminoglycoside phosphotransferase domain-containing protein n=1 Tax=Sporomusa termitida TaxID=2377 RepID=A0A517DNN4_9FIRM|nr:aminoglycoside phosphotransferase family protein [Sporomusa termitida]QDR78918.1 hypothetical protein SPTER_01690 [Sporomusa termitida]
MRINDLVNRIGFGSKAVVFRHENKAIKLFEPGYLETNAYFEVKLQQLALNASLPVPMVYGVTVSNDRVMIEMEYIKGKTLGDRMLADMRHIADFISRSVELQIEVHKVKAKDFPSQKDKLMRDIEAAKLLNKNQKLTLQNMLHSFISEDLLCHGDFHAFNIIQSNQGLVIIDWVDATCGCIAADVCRSFLLYLLTNKEVANLYLQHYCERSTSVTKEEVLKWLPIIAGARLSENNLHDAVNVLLHIVENGRLPS